MINLLVLNLSRELSEMISEWSTGDANQSQQPPTIQHLQLADQLFQAQNFVRLVKLPTSTVETSVFNIFQLPNLGGVLQIVWLCSIVHFRECDVECGIT